MPEARCLYRATSSWAISRTALRTRALVRCHSIPLNRDKRRLFPPRVRSQRVDLVGGHVKLSPSRYSSNQLVPLDPADGPPDDAAVLPTPGWQPGRSPRP